MYYFIALMGEAGAGKDRTMQAVLKAAPDLHEVISCTTRPMRENEAHGVNYFYYTPEQFGQMVLDGEMLECTVFNDWFYGTSFESVRSDGVINIGVFNPTGVESLLARPDCKVLVFRVTTNDKIRLLRQLNREENPDVREVVRRFQADYDDFDNIEFDYITLKNDCEGDIEANVKEILCQSELFFAQGQK
jgi:guanylate kinase